MGKPVEKLRLPYTSVEAYILRYSSTTDPSTNPAAPTGIRLSPIVELQLSGIDLETNNGTDYGCIVNEGLESCIVSFVPEDRSPKGTYLISLVSTSQEYALTVLEQIVKFSRPFLCFTREKEKVELICSLGLN